MKADIVEKAREFAREKHAGQKMDSGKDYMEHLLGVERSLTKWGCDDEVIAAGILHDVVEDTEVTLEELEKLFGKRIAFLVDGASWIRGEDGKKDWQATYKKFCEHSRKDIGQIFVKVADIYYWSENPQKGEEYVKTKSGPRNKTFWIPFFREVGLINFAKRLDKDVNKYLKDKIPETLYEYISKRDLAEIKKKLDKNLNEVIK